MIGGGIQGGGLGKRGRPTAGGQQLDGVRQKRMAVEFAAARVKAARVDMEEEDDEGMDHALWEAHWEEPESTARAPFGDG